MSFIHIKFRCTRAQKRIIKARASSNDMNVSEYLRDIATTGVWDFSGEHCVHKLKKVAIKREIRRLEKLLKKNVGIK